MKRVAKTLKNKVSFEGVGIHTGEVAKITLHPTEGRGIFFYKEGVFIPAFHDYVVGTTLGTDLGVEGKIVKTVEHLMAAFYIAGVDSAVVEVERGNEIPILDGSALLFFEAIEEAGTVEVGYWRTLKIKYYRKIVPNGIFTEIKPFDGEKFVFEGEFPFVGRKRVEYLGKVDKKLLAARTFCRLEDVESLRRAGFGQGGTYINTMVLDENLESLVYSDEPAYHKLLDLIGDLSLLGVRIEGEIYSFRGGHFLNHKVREYLKNQYGIKPFPAPRRV